MSIKKSKGVTPTEQFLADLCDRTFLKLWSYPNPYKSDGKELCDVIAIFDKHVFLFFDRESRKFDNPDDNIEIQWNRWHKTAIEKQIKTAQGAKRYILENPKKIFLDAQASIPFPIPIPGSEIHIHCIIVAHGATEACKHFSPDNINGSLAIAYSDKTDIAHDSPFFTVLERTNPIHVFDSHNLEIILSELDTVYDFTAYLIEKENAISKYGLLTYCGEEDLLAHYFLNFDLENQKYYIGVKKDDATAIMIGEGEWNDFINTSEYKRRKDANKISYLWDELIQRTLQNALDGTIGGNSDIFKGQSAIYEMAKEPRVSRRTISELIKTSINNFPGKVNEFTRSLSRYQSFYKNKVYIFLQVHNPDISDYENQYRPACRALLEIACGVAKNKSDHYNQIIGIGIDAPKLNPNTAEDFILLNCQEWPEEDRIYFEEQNKNFRFFETASLKKNMITSQDIPKSNNYFKPRKVGRNELCPCGSKKKFKRCCA